MKKALAFAAVVLVLLLVVEMTFQKDETRRLEAERAAAATGPAPFDVAVVAAAEARMWRAYYERNTMQVGAEIITLLQSQFRLGVPEAQAIGVRLAQAAATFQNSRGDYETAVLPALEDAYARLARETDRTFDTKAAARAELAWWVARRTRGQDSAENVGKLIADYYAVLYGRTNNHIQRAGLLRAEAAVLRDTGSDWERVESLLLDSYRALGAGLAAAPAS
ncbi:MAG: hypothetical protein KF858_00890 [Candidatus Sumerlaeia bacterium]|nr:hypothetical protein [Candidatus Sumerlaeia bacterium]